ncbi:hypothetical protein [Thiobacillus denitrificans]|uniref:Uncharacterized protein n=1 Tax=Thiobacillus denitrificans TaxID=36861 RepID=A0A119CV92_THIDE|nr:hypothetical protein [Thiobacillus denitrificans]KVW94801.1 hypothetical protein ABW22_11300 [Thiobacillus denitrificans]
MKWFLDLTTRGKLFAGFGQMTVFLATKQPDKAVVTGVRRRGQHFVATDGAISDVTASRTTETLRVIRP